MFALHRVLMGGAALLVLALFLPASAARGQVPDKKDEPKKEEPKPADLDEMIRKEVQQALDRALQRAGMPGVAGRGAGGWAGGRLNPFGSAEEGRLGAVLGEPGATLVEQLDLPKGQGMVLEEVKADSAAAKAGLKAHDILLELNGKMVPSDERGFARLLEEIKPNTPVDAVVLRKGKKETVKGVSLPEAPANALPGVGGIRIRGVPALPGLPGVPGLPGRNGRNALTMSRTPDGGFTTQYDEGNVTLTITGKVVEGKAQVGEIVVKDGDKTNTYKSVAEVPDDLRDDVKFLLRQTEKNAGK
jgi:membrane-associated protease RseP (regulator of RpoE activity)